MPNPAFVPLIGGGFDQLAAQQSGWARFNQGVEENNMARAAQAQQERNNYFARLAALQDQEAARADAFDRNAENMAIARSDQAARDVESRRRFDIGTDLTKAQQALEKQHWDFDISREKNNLDRALSQSENFAKTKADEANQIGQRHDEALANYRVAQEAAQTAISSIESGHPYAQFNPSKKEFVAKSPPLGMDKEAAAEWSKEAAAQADAANAAHEQAKAAFAKATTDYGAAREDWNFLQKELSSYNLTPKRIGKLWGIYSPNHDKTWQPEIPEPGSTPTKSVVPPGWFPGDVHDARNPVPGYAGFNPPPEVLPGASAPVAVAPPAPQNPPTVRTQSDFDALPPGTVYFNANSKKLARKP